MPLISTYKTAICNAKLAEDLFTHWRSIAERGGCFQQRLFVSLFVRTITFEQLNLGWWNLPVRSNVQKSRPSSNLGVKGQGHSLGTKKLLSQPHWLCMVRRRVRCRPYAARSSRRLHCVAAGGDGSARWRRLACGFVGSGLHRRGYAGGKISACCLVLVSFTVQHCSVISSASGNLVPQPPYCGFSVLTPLETFIHHPLSQTLDRRL